jgi:glycosyltransferase involved in cell wall biosynthesis
MQDRDVANSKENKTRISALFLLNSLNIGGSERKIIRVANALAAHGKSVGIAYLNPPEALRTEVSSAVSLFHLERQGKFSRTALRNLKRIIAHHSISHLLSVSLYPSLYLAALRFSKAPFKWTALLNTTDFQNKKQEAAMFLFAPALYLADKYVFGCQYQEELWTRKYKLPKYKSSYIYNGINTDFFTPGSAQAESQTLKKSLGILNNSPVIGTVGRLRPEKCQHLILEAAAKLLLDYPKLNIVLVGDGEQRQYLESRSIELGLSERTFFLGNLLNVKAALSLMDIFLLPSTSVEAMAMGKPLILSDISGAREMVSDGDNGFIVQPGNANMLAEKIAILLATPEKAHEMGTYSRYRAKNEFSFQSMIDKYQHMMKTE